MTPAVMFEKLYSTGLFSDINLHFAEFVAGRCGGKPEVFIAAAFVSRASSGGHICIDLEDFDPSEPGVTEIVLPACRDAGLWGEILLESGAAAEPGGFAPLVLEKPSRLYLFRYWQYEKDLAESILSRARQPEGTNGLTVPPGVIAGFRRSQVFSEPDWQRVAVCIALLKKLCVISGGPGTGKTTVVGDIISLALSEREGPSPRIALAAPTGKAAVRLQEAVAGKLTSLGVPASEIPGASTIHRLLGTVRGSPYFRHNESNLLPFDLVVLDEASMIDLALMSKLVRAVPERSHLVILGDRDQLSSVDPGSVLGDLCGVEDMNRFSASFINTSSRFGVFPDQGTVPTGAGSPGPLLDCLVELKRSYRFEASSGIGEISRAVRLGNGRAAFEMLESGAFPDAVWRHLPSPDKLAAAIAPRILTFYRNLAKVGKPAEALDRFDDFRLLCALREGPYGVRALNRCVEWVLAREGVIRPDTRWYRGRPILVTSNDYNLNLFNGDLGVILPDSSAGGRLRVFFRTGESIRAFAPAGLPEHETVYATTVHKSQGAEFDEALIILPDRPSPVLTRELIYTALTRARGRVEIWGRPEVFIQAVGFRTRRGSGLAHRLWGRQPG
ncbi:MAG: exodeoxyribonuclease V subunit alpha [Desulfatiglandaceae bacterium]